MAGTPGRKRSWTDEQLREAVARARSVHGVFRFLGLKIGGGAQVLVKRHIARLGLDTSHFTGQGWNKGNFSGKLKLRAPFVLDEVLVENSSYVDTNGLKKRLLREGLLRNECYECGSPPVWQGKRLVMRIDHINGNRCDHRLENLRLLCPNCDSQMPTFAGRNKGRST